MKLRILIACTLAAGSIGAADRDGSGVLPPVLRPLEPAESGVLRLPTPPPVTPRYRTVRVQAPRPVPSVLPSQLVLGALPPLPEVPAPLPEPEPFHVVPGPIGVAANLPVAPVPLEQPKPTLPSEAAKEMAFFCQKQIGVWSESEARSLLGVPVRSRAALDERKHPNGKILAFRDPTLRYRELELDFEAKTGLLRTVFVYPRSMTYADVRRRWQGDVNSADAPNGRKFYTYSNRHLDVLVDASGKVISLGLY